MTSAGPDFDSHDSLLPKPRDSTRVRTTSLPRSRIKLPPHGPGRGSIHAREVGKAGTRDRPVAQSTPLLPGASWFLGNSRLSVALWSTEACEWTSLEVAEARSVKDLHRRLHARFRGSRTDRPGATKISRHRPGDLAGEVILDELKGLSRYATLHEQTADHPLLFGCYQKVSKNV